LPWQELPTRRPTHAKRELADCDARLGKYRAALEAGADPVVVSGWMKEVQGERLRAEQLLGQSAPGAKLTKSEIKKLVLALHDIVAVLATADPQDRAEVYAELGVSVTYDPLRRLVAVEARPCTTERVGGGTRNNALRAFDACPAWGSHVGERNHGNPAREVGTAELWLPAA
jgi:hypothetical protein